MKKLIACCGLDCEKCDARVATVNDDNALRKKTAKLWSELNHAPITAEMIHCMGCRVDGVKSPFCDSMCKIRKCVAKQGFATCGDCPKLERCETAGVIVHNNAGAMNNLREAQASRNAPVLR